MRIGDKPCLAALHEAQIAVPEGVCFGGRCGKNQIGDLLYGEKFRDSDCLARAYANAVA
jgi:hypothetical protein